MSSHPMRRARGILFDKDGTLIDFRATWVPAYLGVAAELSDRSGGATALADRLLLWLGYDRAADRFDEDSPLLWDTNAAIAQRWSQAPGIDRGLDVAAIVQRHFTDLDRYPPRAVGDLPALLGRLRRRGFQLGVATMDDTGVASATMTRLGIADELMFLAGADAGHGEKPGPGMALAFCAACALAPDEVIVVGDTPADLHMARRAGCAAAVAVLTGATPRHRLAELADHVLPSVQELESLLEG